MKKGNYIIVLCAFFGFFTFGFLDNIKGAILPKLLIDLNLNYSQGSDILMFNLFGYVIGTLVPSLRVKILNKYKLVSISSGFMIIGIALLVFLNNLILIKFSLFLLGIGFGIMQVAGNSIIVNAFPKNKGKYLNLLTFFNGTGSSLSPIYVSVLLSFYFDWRGIYKLSLILPITLFIISAIVISIFKKECAEQTKHKYVHSDNGGLKIDILLLAFILFFYLAAELGFSSWIVQFLNKIKGFSNSKSNSYLSLFFILLTIGRLLGSFIVERVAYLKILFSATTLAILLLFMGVFLPPIFAVFLPMTGLCFSVIFPTIIAVVSDRYQSNVERILSVLFFFGGIGGILGPWIIGKIAYIFNLSVALAIPGVFCILILMALLSLYIYSIRSKTDSEISNQ